MNKSWAAQRGNSQSSWNDNEKAAAYLSAPSQWTTYCDTSKANYAIGSPPVEMYVASYNQVSHSIGNYTLGATYRAANYPGYIYTVNGTQQNNGYYTNNDTLDYTGYNSIYAGQNGSKTGWWWLASPLDNGSHTVCLVGGSIAYLAGGDSDYGYQVCPLVSLKSGIKLIITSE